jgi:hypothetical protein
VNVICMIPAPCRSATLHVYIIFRICGEVMSCIWCHFHLFWSSCYNINVITFIIGSPHPLVWRLIDYLLFYVPFKNISLIWRRHFCRWRAAKFRPMLGAQGRWEGRDLYRAIPTATRDLGFPVSSEGPPYSVASYDMHGDVEPKFCSPSPVMVTSPCKSEKFL